MHGIITYYVYMGCKVYSSILTGIVVLSMLPEYDIIIASN